MKEFTADNINTFEGKIDGVLNAKKKKEEDDRIDNAVAKAKADAEASAKAEADAAANREPEAAAEAEANRGLLGRLLG